MERCSFWEHFAGGTSAFSWSEGMSVLKMRAVLFLSQSLRDAQRLDMMSLKDDLRSLKGVAGVAR